MEVWLKVWKFLDENDNADSIVDISRRTKVSYPSVLKAIHLLERLNYITTSIENNKKLVEKTKKFKKTRELLNAIYEANQKKDKNLESA